jgi:hypothetical protein
MSSKRAPNIDLFNAVHDLFGANLTCARNWGFYLFGTEFRHEVPLHNRISAIWFTALLDSVEGQGRSSAKLRAEAAKRGLPHVAHYIDQADQFVDAVREVLRLYTRGEQVFIADYRDQLVHCWLGRRHGATFRLKHFDGRAVVVEDVSPEEHASIVRPFYESGPLDDALSTLTQRFRDRSLRYWHVIVELAPPEALQRLYDGIRGGAQVDVHSLTSVITGPAQFSFE